MLHKLLKAVVKTQKKHEIQFLNNQPDIKENVIYAVNHSCKWDTQYMIEIAEKHFKILGGKQRLKIVDRIVVTLNGIIWVDRKAKNSKVQSKAKMLKVLQSKGSLMIFPEGTWNLQPSLPVLPLYWGVVDLSRKSGTPILPVCMEYSDEKCKVKFGELIKLQENVDRVEETNKLRDVFATLKWDIWEKEAIVRRTSIDSGYWEREKINRLDEYPLLDYEYENSCVRVV